MNKRTVGKIRNITYIEEEDALDFTIRVIDNKFKKKILRDLSLAGKIKFEEDKIILIDVEGE